MDKINEKPTPSTFRPHSEMFAIGSCRSQTSRIAPSAETISGNTIKLLQTYALVCGEDEPN